MLKLEFCMKHAVAKTLLEVYKDYENCELRDWIEKWPTQFLLAILDVKMSERLSHILPDADGKRATTAYHKEFTEKHFSDLQSGEPLPK